MKTNRPLTLLMICTLVIPCSVFAMFAPGELIVRLKMPPVHGTLDQVTQIGITSLDAMAEQGQVAMTAPLSEFANRFQPLVESVVALKFSVQTNLDSLEADLRANSSVEWVTRNYIRQANFIPNDSMYSEQWWLENISAPEAWEITRGDSAILLGIIDSGVDYLHPDLISKIWTNPGDANSNGIDDDHNGFVDDSIGWDFVDAPSLPSGGDNLVRDRDPMDELGHGTYVSGIAAASTNNSMCVASIGYNCRIMPLRAGNKDGYLEDDDVAAAILYGAANGVDVLNMSFGDVTVSPMLREVVQIAYQAGVVLVGSAGNDNKNFVHYPSGFPEVISAGSCDALDRKSSFSNYGPSVDVLAPGEEIRSTILGGGCGEWRLSSGTSYACPQVVGLVGLILSVNPNLPPDEVKQLIKTTADDIGRPGWDSLTVHGRINARRAVEQAQFGSDLIARISSPENDAGVSENFTVRGEVWGAAFDHWELSYGLGENPVRWTSATQGNQRIYGDSLGFIHLPAQDTVMIVRLVVYSASGPYSLTDKHLYVQRSAPLVVEQSVKRMLDRDSYGDMIQVRANQVTNASLILKNQTGDSSREDFGYVSTTHTAMLSPADYPGQWQAQILLQNRAGFSTWSDPWDFSISAPPFSSNLWSRTTTALPNGHLGPFVSDIDHDGLKEVWLTPVAEDGSLEVLQRYEWNGTDFSPTNNTYGYHLPEALGDADQDGLLEMMARRFYETRIWEQTVPNGPCDNLVFEDTTNFIGAGFLDKDSLDTHGNIIARINTTSDQKSDPAYVIFQVDSQYRLTAEDTLPNLTTGGNYLGSPRVLIGDLDRDGMLDFLYGDYDGDLIFCEKNILHDRAVITHQWSYRLPLDDATAWIDKGDLDGDGEIEFVAGCTSNSTGGTESQIRSRHWEYYIFKNVTADSFAAVDSIFILGAENTSMHSASVTVADIDADGKADILISAFPDYYVISYDDASHRYTPRWYYSPSESNTTVVGDWNADGINEALFSDGQQIVKIEATTATDQRPRPPVNLSGTPLSIHSIQLAWNRVAGVDSYRVYRATTVPQFDWITSSPDTFIVLDNVATDETFVYAVASVNQQLANPISVLSNYSTVIANAAPTVADTAIFVKPHFVHLSFSEPMGEGALLQRDYHLDDARMPSVVLAGNGGQTIVLAFDGSFERRWYMLTLSGCVDAQGFRMPTTTVVFAVTDTIIEAPQILTHKILGGSSASELEITFSLPMSTSVLSVDHYRIESPRNVLGIRAVSEDRSKIQVSFDPKYPIGSLGLPARLMLRGLLSESAVALDTISGNADLVLGGAAGSLADVFVFPNPYKGVGPNGESGMNFAGLPERATIRIFNLRGMLVRQLEHDNFTGAELWDLKNESHEAVASGVYIYSIESNGSTERGKLAILR